MVTWLTREAVHLFFLGTESPESPGNGMWHATELVRTNGGEVVHLSGAKVGQSCLLVHDVPHVGVAKT